MTVEAYPLQWPDARPRTPAENRQCGRFSKKTGERIATQRRLTVAEALQRLHDEIGPKKFPAKHLVVSSNIPTRQDGLPYSNAREPSDPGVAVYFQLAGEPHCLPCDTFNRVADNIAAIAGHIEAGRKQERYGVASVQQMYTGFRLLEAPGEHWRTTLELWPDAGLEDARLAYRRLRREYHPDREGGDADAFQRIQRAWEKAQKELSGGAKQ